MISEKIKELIASVPLARIVPYLFGAWDDLPEEEKKKVAAMALKAGVKALEAYSGK